MEPEPRTLQEALIYFSNPANCREYVIARRWPNGVICPTCGRVKVKFSEKLNRWQCANHQFTLKSGTIFEESPITLDKWLIAMWLIVNCKNGMSSSEIHRSIGVNRNTAWFMAHRVRMALNGAGADPKIWTRRSPFLQWWATLKMNENIAQNSQDSSARPKGQCVR